MTRKQQLHRWLAVSLFWFATLAQAETERPAAKINAFQRYLIYPHVDKGLSLLKRQDYPKAIEEFKQVRSWAPKSPQTAIYLANAYSLNGNYALAAEVLEEQLEFTPDNQEVLLSLDHASELSSHYQLIAAESLPPDSQELKAYLTQSNPHFYNAFDEYSWLTLLAKTFPTDPQRIAKYTPRYSQNQIYQIEFVLKAALQNHNHQFAKNYLSSISNQLKKDPALLERLSYQLASEDGDSEAINLLLHAYPFAGMNSATQAMLLERLVILVSKNPNLITKQEKVRLATPLNSPELRSIQANLFASLKDCPAVRSVLGDFSESHTEADWRLLGQCYQDVAPGLAEYAYQNAMTMNPSVDNTRAFAYQAFANKNYPEALNAWRSIPLNALSPADLESAALTAVTAKDLPLAIEWLSQFEMIQGKPDALYWWLKAQTVVNEDPELAAQYLRQAIALKPAVDYYSQLANIEESLERPQIAIELLQKALVLDPSNINTQASLAFANYQVGNIAESRKLLDSAFKLNPDNPQVIEQLAYANQRLGNNKDSQYFSELAIDNIDQKDSTDLTPALEAKLFGLRRMHEDLGRRWTLTLDATGGNQVSAVPYSAQPGLSARSYSQAEFAYRLGNPAIDDGKTLSAYSRIFAGSGSQNSAVPIYAPMIAAGLRWKPFSNQAINLAVEEQTPLDKSSYSTTTAMFRASASFFNSGKYSDDWHPNGAGWNAQNLYIDAAHYMTTGLNSLTADYRISRHHKIAQGQTIEPYTHLQWNELNNQVNKDLRIGLGVRWNLWGGQSHYDAYPHKASLGLEFQHAFTTYLNERQAVFLTFGGKW